MNSNHSQASSQKQVAFIVIGDEILSGRTQDVNVQVLSERLNKIGAKLSEVRIVPDDAEKIVHTIQDLSIRYDYVFTSGGIGPTHDDITADCVAKAFGVGIDVRDDARAMLVANYPRGEADLTDARLRMARIPDGAHLIKNPISKAPGFRIKNVFTLAGVPEIFAAMLDDALQHVEHGTITISKSVIINLPESHIATPLAIIAKKFPTIAIGSYPQQKDGHYFAEIIVKGIELVTIDQALSEVKTIK